MVINKRIGLATLVLAACLGLAGCSSKGSKHGHHGHGGADSMGAGDADGFGGRGHRDAMSVMTYYFGFDQYSLTDEDKAMLKVHANNLVKHPKKMVRVEGHTDERGSREYNIGLGERRAHAVTNFLKAEGVSHKQVKAVSYGAEKPKASGHDESAYAENRRAVLVYEDK